MNMDGSETEGVCLLENATTETVCIRRDTEKNTRKIVEDVRVQTDLITGGSDSIRGTVLDGFWWPVT